MADVAAATHDKAGPSKSSLKAQHHLSSGALSGFASSVCLQPLDLLKTRLQQGQGKGYEGSGVKRRKLASVVKEVIREDGVRGLWRGTVPTIVRNVPGVALYFYSLSTIRTKLSSIPYFAIPIPPRSTSSTALPLPGPERSSSSALVKLSSQGNMLAGAIGRTSVGFVLNPITVLKARYESSRYNEYRSLWGSFRLLLATNGVKGLFQGATATAARDAPYAGMSLVFYEKGKDSLSRLIKPEWGVPNAVLHSLSASMAACMATFLTSPADCVKTRMQVDPKEHPTIRKAIGRIYTDRGLSGFFSGSTLRISRKAASGAIAWSVYEAILLFLRDRDLASFAAASASSSSSTDKPLL